MSLYFEKKDLTDLTDEEFLELLKEVALAPEYAPISLIKAHAKTREIK